MLRLDDVKRIIAIIADYCYANLGSSSSGNKNVQHHPNNLALHDIELA